MGMIEYEEVEQIANGKAINGKEDGKLVTDTPENALYSEDGKVLKALDPEKDKFCQ